MEGFGGVPPIRPLETLHNALSLRQLDEFLERMTCATMFRTPASSPPKTSILPLPSLEADSLLATNNSQSGNSTAPPLRLQSPSNSEYSLTTNYYSYSGFELLFNDLGFTTKVSDLSIPAFELPEIRKDLCQCANNKCCIPTIASQIDLKFVDSASENQLVKIDGRVHLRVIRSQKNLRRCKKSLVYFKSSTVIPIDLLESKMDLPKKKKGKSKRSLVFINSSAMMKYAKQLMCKVQNDLLKKCAKHCPSRKPTKNQASGSEDPDVLYFKIEKYPEFVE